MLDGAPDARGDAAGAAGTGADPDADADCDDDAAGEDGESDAGAEAVGERGTTTAAVERGGGIAAGTRRGARAAASAEAAARAGVALALGGAVTSVALSAELAAAGKGALSRDVQAASVFGRAAKTTRATTAAMTVAPTIQPRLPDPRPVFSSVAAHGDAVSPWGPVTTSRRDGEADAVGPDGRAWSEAVLRRATRARVGRERSGANSASAAARSPMLEYRPLASFSRHFAMTAARPGASSARSIGGAGRTSTAVHSCGSPSSWNGGCPPMSS